MRTLRIGSRGSPLALAQSAEVKRRLAAAMPALGDSASVAVIRTSGDAILDRSLADIGGKGLFTKEIDEALLAGQIDLAVHSAKDLPTRLPAGLAIGAVLPREDVRDAFVAATATCPAALPPAAAVGTSSLRRQAQLLARRPDLVVVPLRGNVHTRLAKVERGEVAATLLALAGLRRLGLAAEGRWPALALDEMLPAVGQAAIAVVCRTDDDDLLGWLSAINDAASAQAVAAERAMLAALDGSCRTPIAGLAEIDGTTGEMTLRGLVARPDGSRLLTTLRTGAAADGERLGRDVGEELRRRAGADFFS